MVPPVSLALCCKRVELLAPLQFPLKTHHWLFTTLPLIKITLKGINRSSWQTLIFYEFHHLLLKLIVLSQNFMAAIFFYFLFLHIQDLRSTSIFLCFSIVDENLRKIYNMLPWIKGRRRPLVMLKVLIIHCIYYEILSTSHICSRGEDFLLICYWLQMIKWFRLSI